MHGLMRCDKASEQGHTDAGRAGSQPDLKLITHSRKVHSGSKPSQPAARSESSPNPPNPTPQSTPSQEAASGSNSISTSIPPTYPLSRNLSSSTDPPLPILICSRKAARCLLYGLMLDLSSKFGFLPKIHKKDHFVLRNFC